MFQLLNTIVLLCLVQVLHAQEPRTIHIDLGGIDAVFPWNTLSNSQSGSLTNLIDNKGRTTGINIQVHDAFNGTNDSGTKDAAASLELPALASGDSFFGNQVEWSSVIQPTAGVTLTGLATDKKYSLTLFASRLASDNRESQYDISSLALDTTTFLQVSDNTNEVVRLEGLLPKADGSIVISATTGPNNDNDYGFYYLGVIRLEYEDFIEPETTQLQLTAPLGGEYWQAQKAPEIRWQSMGLEFVTLDYSIDEGTTWEHITTTNARAEKYSWEVPAVDSKDCLVRVTADTLVDKSQAVFEITSEDTTTCHIVVLGSSTAAGTGPSTVDSAWVWMFEDTLFQRDTRFDITNLARGGFTTYNILPTGSSIPAGVTQTIDVTRNITRAMSLMPNALIINLPSNDAANGFSVETQLANYEKILAEPNAQDLPFWICTPQPRNNFSQTQNDIQTDMRDSTYARFDSFAIDFWTTLAEDNNSVHPAYNSGDGVHLNNAGHRILLARVLAENIDSFLLASKAGPSSIVGIEGTNRLLVHPSPTSGLIRIYELEPPFAVKVLRADGSMIYSQENYNQVTLELKESGIQYVSVMKDGRRYGAWVFVD